jgi:hypothetical protein
MKIEMLWHHQLDFMRKVVGYTQTLELSINLQPDHRRLAGRGLERRPRPSAGGPMGRHSRQPEEKEESHSRLHQSVPSAIE